MSDSCYSCRCTVRLCILVWFALHLSFATQTHAATITVTNTNDNGPGSLRQALTIANDGDTINFAVTGTITLTSGGLPINKNITISGPGPDQLSIDGNQAILVFGVFPDKAATISGLTVRNAQSGVLNEGTLTVSNCELSGNSYVGLFNDGVATASVIALLLRTHTAGSTTIIRMVRHHQLNTAMIAAMPTKLTGLHRVI